MQHESLLLSLGLQGSSTLDEESAVCFSIYPDDQNEDLEAMRLELLSLDAVTPFLRDYIWHRDSFELTSSSHQPPGWARKRKTKAKAKGQSEEPMHPHCLWGMVRFGDNIEDEWAVVALLVEMSKARPNLSIQMFDDDGDFLLIEAAYALPRWLKPEIAANRVWMRSGRLHVIPLPFPSSSLALPPSPSLSQALVILKSPESYGLIGLTSSNDDSGGSFSSKRQSNHKPLILAPEAVQKAITDRLGSLPNSARSQLRSSKARLPVNIAAFLLSDPQIISSAIEAFFYRDADDMRAVSRMSHFSLQEADFALVPVLMNRCQQAQLLQQRFAAPRGLSLPQHPPSLVKASELGLKITAGFEIIWARAARLGKLPGSDKTGSSELSIKQLEGLPAWLAYLASLQRSSFFEGEIEGSQRHRELMSSARASFCSGPLLPRSIDRVSEPVVRALCGIETMTQRAESMRSDLSVRWIESQFKLLDRYAEDEEDEEEWARKQAEEVDRELKKREEELTRSQSKGNRGNKGKDNRSDEHQEEDKEEESRAKVLDAADIVDRIGKFVSSVSGLEGAEVGSKARGAKGPFQDEGELKLDPKKLFSDLRRVLGMESRALEASDDDEEEEDSSSEGSSFFSGDDERDEDNEDEDDEGESQFHSELERQLHESRAGLHTSQGEKCEKWEVRTATDSDDDSNESNALSLGDDAEDGDGDGDGDGDDEEEDAAGASSERHAAECGRGGFFDVYTEALEAQLRGTHMDSSFERLQPEAPQGEGKAPQGEGKQSSRGPSAAPASENLRPIDLDLNLVKNLLKSVAAQQGSAGPASNLASMLGVDLPHLDVNDLK